MTELASTGLSGLSILFIAFAIWFLTGKGTRKVVGDAVTDAVSHTADSIVEASLNANQALVIARLASIKEAEAELGDLEALIGKSNNLLKSARDSRSTREK